MRSEVTAPLCHCDTVTGPIQPVGPRGVRLRSDGVATRTLGDAGREREGVRVLSSDLMPEASWLEVGRQSLDPRAQDFALLDAPRRSTR